MREKGIDVIWLKGCGCEKLNKGLAKVLRDHKAWNNIEREAEIFRTLEN